MKGANLEGRMLNTGVVAFCRQLSTDIQACQTHHKVDFPGQNHILTQLGPAQRVRPDFSPDPLSLFFALPPSFGLRRLDSRHSFAIVKLSPLCFYQKRLVDHMVLSYGETGKVVTGVIQIWSFSGLIAETP